MRILVMAAVFIFFSAFGAYPAMAYIDPGTGSVIFGAIGYMIAAGAAFIAIAIKPVKMLYNRVFKKNKIDSEVEAEIEEKALKDKTEI
ncbi:MAG: hypothetical protein JW984_16710 [Deltaproteobacteria bacterium]|uniref:Uncharacterized protein n=1 Tax=Candidatus Zymogenus saltonus TaxID=2844893 RepID=A0A9D8KHU5_9DELT|nr:hypothetical protein [Candidatus Zymogenus saltonus]